LTQRLRIETRAIVAAEIFYGARTAQAEQQSWSVLNPFVIHPFTVEMPARQCAIMQEFSAGSRIPDIRDIMIAATALELSLPIATVNRRHFEHLAAVELLDAAGL
jgi:predicted nucleic acid-binding protein